MIPSARIGVALLGVAVPLAACSRAPAAPPGAASNLLLVTIDTLRADHVGAYGYPRSQASFVDRIAENGAVFTHAYAAAPITLPSHATILTGRYPPGHGARDNGLHVRADVRTLATELKTHGFRTAAFVAAFPLDHQFGLDRGFDVYSDHLPRTPDGKQANERPAAQVVDEAIAWLGPQTASPQSPSPQSPSPRSPSPQSPVPSPRRFFLWLHVFEPHAPYGNPADSRPILERYDEEIGSANRELLRLLAALDRVAPDTVVIAAADHGEAFGEHGEYAHSIFVYDTTLRVPLVMRAPGIAVSDRAGRIGVAVADPVSLADIAPTAMHLLGFAMPDVDGVDLSPAWAGQTLPSRELYAESFAPLLEFGWAPLRTIVAFPWKFIAAPTSELYDLAHDGREDRNVAEAQPSVARGLDASVARYSLPNLPTAQTIDASGLDRLRALGYANGPRHDSAGRVDPKDRKEIAARIAQVTSGELSGAALISALEQIVTADPSNSQAHLRLGYERLRAGDCAHAEREFQRAIDGGLPGADPQLGLATCLGRRNDVAGAERTLDQAKQREPANPVIDANIGILQIAKGNLPAAIAALQAALRADPDLHEARFNLALAYAKAGRRSDAAAAARDLMARLPPSAPQRAEVERLLRALQ